jgi:tRNA pseudouridine38-40 synthase
MEDDPDLSDRAAPNGPLCRVALGVAYNGRGFRGFAIQPNVRTVAGQLMVAISHIAGGVEPTYTCAGRTDAGVHALAQVLHVDVQPAALTRALRGEPPLVGTELPDLARSLNRQLGPEIFVWRAVIVDQEFDARRCATARRYRYDLGVGVREDPLRSSTMWWVGPGLDLAAMRLGCDPLIGPHNFAGFCRRPPGHVGPLERRVHDARIEVLDGDIWRFEIEASSFCHQMVRSIVGTLVSIGQGRQRPSDVVQRLRIGERRGAPPLAPPEGLCLVSVTYPDSFGGCWQ